MADDNGSEAVQQYRFAVLIDGENAQPSLLNGILGEVKKHGTAIIRRIYGDWTSPQMNGWKTALNTHAIQPIQQFRYTTGKNATDSALIIDAMDILYTLQIDAFCIVSSDSDYTRLATRIREKGMMVMGIGKRSTPEPFVKACVRFTYTEDLGPTQKPKAPEAPKAPKAPKAAKAPETPKAAKPPKSPPKDKDVNLFPLFQKAFNQVQSKGWADLPTFGTQLRKLQPGFEPSTYGFKNLSDMLRKNPDIFEIDLRKQKESVVVYMRIRPEAK